jgi:hypothetical protein
LKFLNKILSLKKTIEKSDPDPINHSGSTTLATAVKTVHSSNISLAQPAWAEIMLCLSE